MILEAAMDADGDFHFDFHDYETSDSEVSSIDENDIEEGTCGMVFFLICVITYILFHVPSVVGFPKVVKNVDLDLDLI